ncbi:Holliday junction resolvase RuvX [Poritiphilus flavus]|uniref:Putative pre-16S rRNA nuclease n=1 Tax=Poritiphilus flavus TaxID=2697053 RepID=A0A6L9E9W0_9FLAO|nr:Holliday junction resolvase RuvX [Poritiphilus flavus]NAS11279.1 Holliday junction resolvase RuvX [Poritiphilus flavus]
MARILALDYGSKRTGIAVTDELQLIASGLTTVPTSDLMEFLTDYLAEEKVEKLVVGEPKQMDNSVSESEEMILGFIEKWTKTFPAVPVERQDERFTSKLAVASMVEQGIKKKRRREKDLVDEISAVLILQAYLNRIKK